MCVSHLHLGQSSQFRTSKIYSTRHFIVCNSISSFYNVLYVLQIDMSQTGFETLLCFTNKNNKTEWHKKSKASGKEQRWKILSSDELREVLGPEQMVWVDEQENVWALMGPFVATHVYNPEGVNTYYAHFLLALTNGLSICCI